MKKFILTQLLLLFFLQAIVAQNIIKGITVESESEKPLQNVLIRIVNTNLVESTAIDGAFTLKNVRNGRCILEVKFSNRTFWSDNRFGSNNAIQGYN
jgi:hypothetical protein